MCLQVERNIFLKMYFDLFPFCLFENLKFYILCYFICSRIRNLYTFLDTSSFFQSVTQLTWHFKRLYNYFQFNLTYTSDLELVFNWKYLVMEMKFLFEVYEGIYTMDYFSLNILFRRREFSCIDCMREYIVIKLFIKQVLLL